MSDDSAGSQSDDFYQSESASLRLPALFSQPPPVIQSARGEALPRSVAQELLKYVNSAKVKLIKITTSDKRTFEAPQVLLCARSKTLELMINKLNNGDYTEGMTKTLNLPEDGELMEAFLMALRYDRVPWLQLLTCEITTPGSVPPTVKATPSEYFVPLISGTQEDDLSLSVPYKQVLLGRLLDLFAMAHKYEFEGLCSLLETSLQSFKTGLWDTPLLVLGILRLAILIGNLNLQSACKTALQQLRGGDLLAWLNPDPLSFWQGTRKHKIYITSPTGEFVCCVRAALSDTIFYVKEYLTTRHQSDLVSLQAQYSLVTPAVLLLQHKGMNLDSKKTLEECQVEHDDTLKVHFIRRRVRVKYSLNGSNTSLPPAGR
eukprot:Blabericola_migrator_1__634@NODE_1158_length_5254_cov_72_579719_g788_i0_p3_GENE_NODE_1158_length_5254_cov_72_579719_g788_i0NODE_1158_length_5254_cov_72_579719_g788_i0_p3_ORF_typecomplete_len374_score55_60BTB/PF00651_31/0_0094BTB/PF00651_31/3_6e03BTB/PF00651_31/1_5e04ubiquitin/PF00240_23/0_0034Rad60SLD_2/PF13881_6/0_035Skp1_POZ/PF03931_15/0_12_NODE_1158_length_5254_cov_72_579719_g788_i040475168